MVELFCGILSGGAFGPHIRRWGQNDVPANLVSSNFTCPTLLLLYDVSTSFMQVVIFNIFTTKFCVLLIKVILFRQLKLSFCSSWFSLAN